MAGKAANDFEKIIHADRDRKKKEALAARIFNKDRRNSAPFKTTPTAGSSLASRVGVKKRVASTSLRHSLPGNINGEWTHDLHNAGKGSRSNNNNNNNNNTSSLISRISTTPTNINGAGARHNQRRAAQVANALVKTELLPSAASQVNVTPSAAQAPSRGLSIRGLAGPFVVMAQNFAPGTTAADIESAVMPVGGLVQSCRLLKTQPIVVAEIVFESKEGADQVIATFNNQTADGRVLHVYPKVGGGFNAPVPTGPRAAGNSGNVVDGSMGFDNSMEMDASGSSQRRNAGGLYSDSMVGSSRRGGTGRRGGR